MGYAFDTTQIDKVKEVVALDDVNTLIHDGWVVLTVTALPTENSHATTMFAMGHIKNPG